MVIFHEGKRKIEEQPHRSRLFQFSRAFMLTAN